MRWPWRICKKKKRASALRIKAGPFSSAKEMIDYIESRWRMSEYQLVESLLPYAPIDWGREKIRDLVVFTREILPDRIGGASV